MTREEAKKVFLNRGYVEVDGGTIYDADKWRESCTVISEWLIEQEPKKGHWINSNIPNEEYVCSECGGACWYYDYQAKVAKSKYCPNCGVRMVEPQESEENKSCDNCKLNKTEKCQPSTCAMIGCDGHGLWDG